MVRVNSLGAAWAVQIDGLCVGSRPYSGCLSRTAQVATIADFGSGGQIFVFSVKVNAQVRSRRRHAIHSILPAQSGWRVTGWGLHVHHAEHSPNDSYVVHIQGGIRCVQLASFFYIYKNVPVICVPIKCV